MRRGSSIHLPVNDDWDDDTTFPDEEVVCEIASQWSVDPCLEKYQDQLSTGYLCHWYNRTHLTINHIIEMFDDDFFVMFIPTQNILNCSKKYKLHYTSQTSFKDKYFYQKEYHYQKFDTQYYQECLKNNEIIMIDIHQFGTFVFTNFLTSEIFQVFQKIFRKYTCLIFEAADDFGYFKLLRDGRISRKIASHGCIDGMISYAHVRGKPCEYEIRNNKIYKMNFEARDDEDTLKDFGRNEILDMIDFYLDFQNITNERIDSVLIYKIDNE